MNKKPLVGLKWFVRDLTAPQLEVKIHSFFADITWIIRGVVVCKSLKFVRYPFLYSEVVFTPDRDHSLITLDRVRNL